MKPAIENEVQIYEQEHIVKIFWRKEFLEDEQSEKKKIKDSILEKYKGKLVVDFKKNNGKIEPCDIILQLTKEIDCGTFLDSLLQCSEEIKFLKVESTMEEGERQVKVSELEKRVELLEKENKPLKQQLDRLRSYSDVYLLRQQLPNWLAMFPSLISIQKRKQKRDCCQRIQKLKRLVGKTMPSWRICLQTRNSAIQI